MDGKFSSKVARSAVAAGLALAMAASPVIPATVALADTTTYGTGSITIKKVEGNDTTFKGYQIFKAKVTDSKDPNTKSVSDLEWASDAVKTAVETAVETATGKKQTFATPQDGADWIQKNVTGTDVTTAVKAGSIADDIAKEVSKVESATTVTPDDPTTLTEGYWLFVTTHSTLGDGEAATAPIFAVVGGTGVTVTEKDTVPTVKKTLADGKTTSGSTGVGKVIDYKLEGTVASNIDTYDTYAYTFNDTLSDGLDYVDSATVMVDGKDVTKQATITYSDHKLTIAFTDLKKVATLTKDSKVTVEYKAKVNKNAVAGTGSNLSNQVSLTYSNDPHSTGTGTTKDNPTVKEYTYKLKLVKRDRDTEKALDGATFTVKSGDKFVQADGSLGDKEHVFTANGDDGFTVNGLDAGTYTVTEKDAPTGYDKTGAFTFTITPTIEKDELTGLANEVNGNTDVIAGDSDNTPGDHQLQAKNGTAANVEKGTVTVTVGDKKEITMPLTGMKGTTALVVYGSAILVISAAAYIKHRRGAADSE